MIFELPIVVIVIGVLGYLAHLKRSELEGKVPLVEPLKRHFEHARETRYSIFQHLLTLVGHPNLRFMCVILTLKRNLLPSSVWPTADGNHLVFNGYLKVQAPCFYAFRKGINLKHYGLNHSKKYLIENIPEYKLYGRIEEKHIRFLKKYSVAVFYVSYVPNVVSTTHNFNSRVFLKCKMSLLDEEGFLDDLMHLFDEVREESQEKIRERRQAYLREVGILKARESQNFVERLAAGSREMRRGGARTKHNK
jgi:hypothetical protein